ncbi:hypothetical protein [Butyrivibrio sp. AC2005]|uniref:hypothetical protein n=1 Tax=Butyrivibrio sp. AC2005 TaxID=1280672 RepID=UPI00040C2FBF|nr:hypothetical protein [Butyrivibrio sp. AC2005]
MNKKGLISILLTALLIFTVVAGVFTQTPVKADAAEGRWVLQSSETVYGNDEYLGTTYQYDHVETDGQMVYYLTRTFSNINGTHTGLYTTTADIPPAIISAGQRVEMRLSATLQGGLDNHLCDNSVDIRRHSYWEDGSSRGSGDRFKNVLTDSQDDGYIDVWAGPPSNRQYEDAGSFYYVFDEGEYEGQKMTIRVHIYTGSMSGGKDNGGLVTDWNYIWTTSGEDISYTEEGMQLSENEIGMQSFGNGDETSTGMWLLQSSETVYGNEEYLGTIYQYSHEQIDGQMVYRLTRRFSNINGTFTGLYTTIADIPPADISAGERVEMRLSATLQGGMDNQLCDNSVDIRKLSYWEDGSRRGAGDRFKNVITDSQDDGYIDVWAGPPSNRQYEDAGSFYYVFPEGEYEGEKMTIRVRIYTGSMSDGKDNGGLVTDWNYVWKSF